MNPVYIIAANRTPVGDFKGKLSSLKVVELGTIAARDVVKRGGADADTVEEVICGMIYKGGAKGNPARQVQLAAGFPSSGYAMTVDQQCGSGMRAVEILSQQIMLGKTKIGVAVGMESMSNAAYILNNARNIKMGDAALQDSLTLDGLNCAICNYHMGITAENLAEKYGISRQEQDELALLSHNRARKAQSEGKFTEEIIPVEIVGNKGAVTLVDTDEHPRETSFESLAKLRPAFKKDGTITSGNASGINDAAAALLLAGEEATKKYGLKPIAKIVSTCSMGVAPEVMGIGPAYAIPKALAYAGLSKEDIGYYEINEAFAAQFLACNHELKLSMDIVNVNGSGIGIGHPVGCTGVRIITSLISEMKRRSVQYGAASLCVGGGPAMAVIIENI